VESEGSIGSIGAVGRPVYDSHNNRVKGFCTTVITSPEMVYPLIEEARKIRDATRATRITLRFVTTVPLELGRLAEFESSPRIINTQLMEDPVTHYFSGFETIPIPLGGSWRGYWVQYFGENSRERIAPKNVREKEDEIVYESLRTARWRDPFQRVRQAGYRIEIGIRDDSDIKQLSELYNLVYRDYTFPLTEDNIRALVKSPTSITALARDNNGNIVSVAVAEVAEILTDRGLLRISELSDEATHPYHRNKGSTKHAFLH
jgi:hypothetical protein